MPTFFLTQNDFRDWLEKNHATAAELIVGYYKVGSGRPSMTWPESVDQALCFGWIDGVRRSVDKDSYCIRFTPRRSTSIWSDINIKKVEELTQAGLMKPEGLQAFALRKDHKSRIYAYEKLPSTLDPVLEKQFQESETAWKFFNEQPKSYKNLIIHWIMAAKQEKTKLDRLAKTIQASESQKRLQ
jgi:uncharacterized protein YdeI (YjbR/CyaY-like superfamily)